MPSQLSSVPVEHRRQAAATAGLLAALLIAVGIVPWAAPAPGSVRMFSTVALAAGVLLGLVARGLLSSIRAEQAESQVDAQIASAVADFNCDHDHDPDELHMCPTVDACTHDCASCLRG